MNLMKNSEKLPKSVNQDRQKIKDLILLESYPCADTIAKKTKNEMFQTNLKWQILPFKSCEDRNCFETLKKRKNTTLATGLIGRSCKKLSKN